MDKFSSNIIELVSAMHCTPTAYILDMRIFSEQNGKCSKK